MPRNEVARKPDDQDRRHYEKYPDAQTQEGEPQGGDAEVG
jgi:hypothetical protein